MAIYNEELKHDIEMLFNGIENDAKEIIKTAPSFNLAVERIMNLVSSRLTTECEGYIYDIYFMLANKIKKEKFFQDPNHLNAFYRLNLEKELNEKYHFEIQSVNAYKNGINFKEINKLYASAGVAAGTFAVGGILKYAISGVITIPFAVLIAGAAAAAFSTYSKVIPEKNLNAFVAAVKEFLKGLKSEIINWLNDIEDYFNNRVKSLYFID